MKVEFAGVELAKDGDGFTDVIKLSPLSRVSNSETLKIIGAHSPFFKDNKNCEYTLKITVPYILKSYDEAVAWLFQIANILDKLPDAGDLRIVHGNRVLLLSDTIISATFPNEINGCFFEVEYAFKGRNPKQENF